MLKEFKIDRQHVDIYLVELKYNYCICTLTEEFRLFFFKYVIFKTHLKNQVLVRELCCSLPQFFSYTVFNSSQWMVNFFLMDAFELISNHIYNFIDVHTITFAHSWVWYSTILLSFISVPNTVVVKEK